jgi:hypothetical protein
MGLLRNGGLDRPGPDARKGRHLSPSEEEAALEDFVHPGASPESLLLVVAGARKPRRVDRCTLCCSDVPLGENSNAGTVTNLIPTSTYRTGCAIPDQRQVRSFLFGGPLRSPRVVV